MITAPLIASVSDVFAVFGGPSAVARILALNASTASEMKRRNSIPVRYWPALIRASIEIGKPFNEADLVRVHQPEAASKPEAAA